MKIKIALILLFLLPSLSPAAEHYYSFKTLDVRSGLSQNTVNSIIQDRKGFMWLATKDGLNRYDGDEFVVLRNLPSDPNSLCNNFITTLLEDSSGNIWVGTDNGLDLFIVDEERFHHIPLPRQAEQAPKSTILDLKQAPGGNIWFSIESVGLIEYDLKTQHTRIFSAQDLPALSNISSIYFTPTGTTYLGCYGHGLYYISMRGEILPYTDPTTGKQPFAGSLITSITTAPYNGIYIGSMDKGVRELNFSSSQLREVLTTDSKRDLVRCRALLMANTSELLCGTESGLFIVDISTPAIPQASTLTTPQATTHLRSSYYDPYALSANSIYSIYKDREGGIWLGTYFGGVNYNNPRFDAFEKYYPTNTPDCLRGKRVREIVEDPSGTLWVGTEDEGLQIFDPQTRSFSQFEPSQLFNNIHGLCLVGEQLWVGTISKGIRVIDTRKRRLLRSYDASNALIDNNIYSIRNTQMGGESTSEPNSGLCSISPRATPSRR